MKKKQLDRHISIMFLSLLVYGLLSTISSLGYISDDYLLSLFRIELVIILYFITQRIEPYLIKPSKYFTLIRLIALSLCILTFTIAVHRGFYIRSLYAYYKKYYGKLYKNDLKQLSGVYPGKVWKKTLNTFDEVIDSHTLKQNDLWSTYAGLAEIKYNVFNPSGYDYIIHALGKQKRAEYLSKFIATKPKYVITIKENYFPYEEWLQKEHWNFYQEILENYEEIASTEQYYVFKRRVTPLKIGEFTEKNVTLKDNRVKIMLDKERPANVLYVAKITYKISNPYKRIPILGNMQRYLIYPFATRYKYPVSLPPYYTSMTFPFIPDNTISNKEFYLYLYTLPKFPGTHIEITSFKYAIAKPTELKDK